MSAEIVVGRNRATYPMTDRMRAQVKVRWYHGASGVRAKNHGRCRLPATIEVRNRAGEWKHWCDIVIGARDHTDADRIETELRRWRITGYADAMDFADSEEAL